MESITSTSSTDLYLGTSISQLCNVFPRFFVTPFLSRAPRSSFLVCKSSMLYFTRKTTADNLGMEPYARSGSPDPVFQQKYRQTGVALSILYASIRDDWWYQSYNGASQNPQYRGEFDTRNTRHQSTSFHSKRHGYGSREPSKKASIERKSRRINGPRPARNIIRSMGLCLLRLFSDGRMPRIPCSTVLYQ